jgi:exopolysaccharide biosynthesis WecB/TagA/CpsF family protein
MSRPPISVPGAYGARAEADVIELFGLHVAAATAAEMIANIRTAALSGRVRIAYVNAHTLNLACRYESLRAALQHSDFVLNDGAGVALAARIHGRRFPANLQGSDFNLQLLRMVAFERWPVFLLGGRPGIADRAAAEIARAVPGVHIAGTRHGYHRRPEHDVAAITASGAEVLLVAMGNPRQELWLEECFRELPHVRVGVGVGAFLDFQAKVISRAPGWMNDCKIEWLYRLAQEPRRLSKRYIIGNPQFVLRVMRERIGARSAGVTPSDGASHLAPRQTSTRPRQ